MQGEYRVGIIGTGRVASSIEDELTATPVHLLLPYSHAGAYAAVPATRIVAAADTHAERLDEFGRRWQVPALYADYREMLARERLDIVSICTPTRTHAEVALAVAEQPGVRGIFLEKPIAQSLAEADRIVDACAARGSVAAVNHFRTYDVYYRRIRELIAAGTLGEIRTVLAHWHEGILFGGSHLFDLLRCLLGAEAEWVFGRLDAGDGVFDPGGSGVIGFRGGVEALINIRTGHAAPSELDIVGTDGRIRVGRELYPELYTREAGRPGGALVRRGFPGAVVARSAMTTAVLELVGALEGGPKPGSDLRDARADLEIAVAFHLSDRRGVPQRLPVDDRDYLIRDTWGRN